MYYWQRPQDIPQEVGEGRGKGGSEVLFLKMYYDPRTSQEVGEGRGKGGESSVFS